MDPDQWVPDIYSKITRMGEYIQDDIAQEKNNVTSEFNMFKDWRKEELTLIQSGLQRRYTTLYAQKCADLQRQQQYFSSELEYIKILAVHYVQFLKKTNKMCEDSNVLEREALEVNFQLIKDREEKESAMGNCAEKVKNAPFGKLVRLTEKCFHLLDQSEQVCITEWDKLQESFAIIIQDMLKKYMASASTEDLRLIVDSILLDYRERKLQTLNNVNIAILKLNTELSRTIQNTQLDLSKDFCTECLRLTHFVNSARDSNINRLRDFQNSVLTKMEYLRENYENVLN